jgi:hypothetical protein
MPIDTAELEQAGSDAWWLRRLAKEMHTRPVRLQPKLCDDRRYDYTRSEWLDMLWARFVGNTPLTKVSERYADATREFMRLTRTNFAALIVEALQDRTQFVGAQSVGNEDADGDDTVRDVLSANGAFFDDAITYAYTLGRGYVMVSPPQGGETVATATAEDPRLVSVATDPIRTNVVTRALKMYHDADAEVDTAHLFVRGSANSPDRVAVAVRPASSAWSGLRFVGRDWTWDAERSGPLPVQGMGVPIIPLVNKLGLGEFETHLDLLDRISNDIADRIWTSKFQTFIQKAIEGDLPDVHPVTGEKINYDEIFSSDPGALWRLPPGAKIWESKTVDINGLLAPVRDDLKELSAVTRTPMHLFTPDAMTGSAAGANLASDGITLKAGDRTKRLAPAAVRFSKLALAYSGKPVTGELQAMWGPIERFSLQERGAAAVAAKGSGTPWRSIMSDVWQHSPATVARMERERRADLLFDGDQ